MQKLGETLINTIGSVLSAQLTNITNAVGPIINFVSNDVLPNVLQLPQEILVKIVVFLGHLLEADNMIRILIQGITARVFPLVAQLNGALEGLATSILASLMKILNLVPNCSDCPSLQR